MTPKKYFVTGATGFIGGRLVRQLRDQGHQVIASVRDPARAQHLAALGVEVVPGDVTNKESLRQPMTGVEGIFHLAGWYQVGVRDTSPGQRINVDGTRNVLELMRELNIPRGVYTSTLAVNGDTHGRIVDETYSHDGPWLSEYDRTKWVAHYEIAEPMIGQGLPLVIVMPGAVYGPGDASPQGQLFQQYLSRKLLMVPRGSAFCWGHVEDTARGHVLAMERGASGQSYIIAGQPATLVEVLREAERMTGVPAPRLHPSPALVKAVAAIAGAVERVAPVPDTMSSEYLRVAAGVTYLGSNAKAKRELGFEVRPLDEGLRETLADGLRRLET
ncbi:MAG: NAD-dependent epimerase/dehydratase family protein [Chloroflexi bacterium]|nr:NAD-dependent epimerase/dehydratase family protein [Chloroflexota bacterium]